MKTYELICVVCSSAVDPPDHTVRCIAWGQYTAVLSAAPRKAIQLPVSRKEALKSAVERQRIFEALMPEGTVLVAKSQQWLNLEQVELFLSANAVLLADLQIRLAGKSQFQITVTWDESKVFSRFRNAPELVSLFEKDVATKSMVEDTVARLRNRLANQIRELLQPKVADLLSLPIVEDILSNSVVLIANSQESTLDRCVDAIDAIWPEGFRIRQIGPSPAGSFALLNLTWVSTKDIKAAHEMLTLKIGASTDEQRRAERRILMQPDIPVEDVKWAARIVASTAPGLESGFHIAAVLSEEKGLSATKLGAVA